MQFKELGTQNEKTMVLLPGTGCTWELNFSGVVDDLSAKYHLICVDYDGFETDPAQRTDFTDILTIVSKVEDHIIENFNGRVDAAYGSSLGGTFAIHDIFSGMKYGDMQAFVRKLKDMGYEDVRLIDTTNGSPIKKSEATWIGLTGSALLVGKK